MAEPKMGNCVKFIPAGEEHYRCNCGLDRSGCGACGAGWGAKHHRMIQSGEAIVGDDGLLLVKPSVPTKMVSMDGAWCMSELGSDLQRLLAPGSDAGMLAQTTTEGLASSKDENTPLDLVLDWIARKPLDASDVGGALSLADARAEIKFIREFAAEFLRSAGVEDEGAEDIETDEHEPADQAVRGALYDKQDLSSFRKVTYEKSNEVRKLIYDIIIKLNVLFEHDTGEALQIIDAFKPLAFKRGETIIEQGDAWSEFFVVERGGLSANVTTKMLSRVKVGEYSEGSSFGESALIFGSPSASTITATTDCKLWSIDRTTYRSIIGKLRIDQYEEKSRFIRECVVGGKKFAGTFDDSQIEDLTIATKVDCYQKGDVILREGELGDTFYIVASGLVERCRSDRRDVAVIERKKTFGTTSLLKGVSSPFTYKAKTPVTVYYLTKSDFELIMGSLRDALDGNSVANSRMMARSQSIKTSMSTDRKYNLELKDLGFFNMLGRGAFGQVRLVQEKKLRKVFALKAQSKHSIVMKGNEERVLNEYHMMKEMDHPFIAGMHCAMQDRHHLYFLMDLLPGESLGVCTAEIIMHILNFYWSCWCKTPHHTPGGELMPYLVRKIKQGRGFEEDITKFYAASVVLVYEKIHSLSIAYRDLK